MVQASTVLFIGIGAVAGMLYYTLIHPLITRKGTKVRGSFLRYRPILQDAEAGLLGEIEATENLIGGKIRVYLDTGEARTYDKEEIIANDIQDQLSGKGRPVFTIRPKSRSDTRERDDNPFDPYIHAASGRGRARALEDNKDEFVHKEVTRFRDAIEATKPTRPRGAVE